MSNPAPGVAQALVIVGADKRGAIYGVYDLSQQIGVSPWYFWADVPTVRRQEVWALEGVKVSKSPSVKYRGIFLNDEAPGTYFSSSLAHDDSYGQSHFSSRDYAYSSATLSFIHA